MQVMGPPIKALNDRVGEIETMLAEQDVRSSSGEVKPISEPLPGAQITNPSPERPSGGSRASYTTMGSVAIEPREESYELVKSPFDSRPSGSSRGYVGTMGSVVAVPGPTREMSSEEGAGAFEGRPSSDSRGSYMTLGSVVPIPRAQS